MLEFRSFVSYCFLLLCISMILMHEHFPTDVRCADFSNETDMLALLAFKDRITDDPLNVLSSWNHSLHFCQWKGITCGRRHQRVTVLDLNTLQLSGSISPSTGNLSFLQVIDLGNNGFTGEVPQEISQLFRLQELILESNSLGGHIPANLSSCSRMTMLDLSENNFTGHIPANLGSMSKLLLLYLANNNLKGIIPPSLGNLSALEEFYLSHNQLVGGIPESLSHLQRLTVFSVHFNSLTGLVPPFLYNRSYLAIMSLSSNDFEGNLPHYLGHNINLDKLGLAGNQFSGTIPSSLSNASNLQFLDLASNQFVGGVPTELGNLKRLYWLGLGGNNLGSGEIDDLSFITSLTNCSLLTTFMFYENNFGGVLPNSLANLSMVLKTLFMHHNQISGNIPQGIGNLINVNALAMYNNQLTGVIPETIGNLNKMEQVGFGKNNLSGRIPSSLGNLTLLSWLFIERNNLEGSIPPSLGNCQKLELLHLYGNKLSGAIPREVIGLPSLSISLNLSHNHLSGSLPAEVGNLKNLAELDVSWNKLNGDIPSSLGDCTILVRLYMNDNSFGGSIPNSLSSLRGIEELDLSLNNLTGIIPRRLGTLRVLQKLNLSFNDLEGEVPLEGAFTNTSVVSLVGNKRLCGGIPDLHLPKCSTNESRKHKMPLFLKVLIPIICALLVLALVLSFLVICWNRKVKKQPTPTTSLVDPFMNLSYGDIFRATNGFSATNLIGIGSFGSVYYGTLEFHEQVVAVKVLNLQKEGATRSFVTECQALRNIKHRNLVKVITVCSSIDYQGNDFKALVYEFMPNGSLEMWLHQPPMTSNPNHEPRSLSLSQRLNVVIDVAVALDYLHNHCDPLVIHRDLKPSNILIDNDMVAHVSDFGLAKTIMECNGEVHLSQSSSSYIKGTIGYAPPEYGIGNNATTQGDVYSFGILVLEIFTGKRPTDIALVDGSSLHEMVKKALPEGLMEIIDCSLLSRGNKMGATTLKCLAAIFEIGVACSEQSPRNRPKISDVANKLKGIKDKLIKERIESIL